MGEVQMRFEVPFGHRLQRHKGKCRFPHGHNYIIEVTIRGPLNEQGMVIDFSDAKQLVRDILDPFDHAFVLEESDRFVDYFRDAAGDVDEARLPVKMVLLNVPPTAENLAMLFREQLRKAGLYTIVTVWEQRDCSATARGADADAPLPQIVEVWR